jgi:hypothetical protein
MRLDDDLPSSCRSRWRCTRAPWRRRDRPAALALLGWWLLIGGGVTMWLGWFTQNGPADAGWTAYDPLSDSTNTPGDGMYLWIIGVMLAATSAALLSASILGTIMRRRAPGMTLLRMPVFTWSMLMTSILMIVAAPALLVAMGLLFYERVYGGVVNTMPRFAALMMLFAMANCGLPATSGFVGEFMVIMGAMKFNFWIALIAGTTLVFGAAYTRGRTTCSPPARSP